MPRPVDQPPDKPVDLADGEALTADRVRDYVCLLKKTITSAEYILFKGNGYMIYVDIIRGEKFSSI